MKFSFFIFIFNFIIFSITPKYFKTPDTITTRLVPISIILEGNFDLNEYFGDPEDYLEDKFIDKSNYKYSEYRIESTKDGKSYFHWGIVTIQNGKFYPSYPVVLPILNLPFYIIAAPWIEYRKIQLEDLTLDDSSINKLDGLISSFWAAIAGSLLFYYIQKYFNIRYALLISFVYTFLSPAWSLLSHNTWQQTLNIVLLPLLIILLKMNQKIAKIFFGFLFALLIFNRPSNIFYLPIVLLGDWRNINSWKYWILGGILPFSFFLTLHLLIYSHPIGPYYYHSKMIGGMNNFSFSKMWDHFLALMFSPARGLFIFLPYLIIILPYAIVKKKNLEEKIYLGIIILFILFYSTYTIWDGGWNYGPRFLSELLPFFCILFAYQFNDFLKFRQIKIAITFSFILALFIHLQPAISKEFLKWEACNLTPYHQKIWDWKYSPITSGLYKIRLLWKESIEILPKELCHIPTSINPEGSFVFHESDFTYVLPEGYPMVFESQYYFPKGNYIIELEDKNREIVFMLKKRNLYLNTNPESNLVNIEKPGFYSIILLSKKPIRYKLKKISIQKYPKI